MEEADGLYLAIKGWWLSSCAVTKDAICEFDNWLAFWYSRYRQWGGFVSMVHPCKPHRNLKSLLNPNTNLKVKHQMFNLTLKHM